jgi:hypothetical protein
MPSSQYPHSYTKGSPRVSSWLLPDFLFEPLSSWFPPRSPCPLSRWKPCLRVRPILEPGRKVFLLQGLVGTLKTGILHIWPTLPPPYTVHSNIIPCARTFKRLWSPGIDSKESILAAYEDRWAGTITLFLLGS